MSSFECRVNLEWVGDKAFLRSELTRRDAGVLITVARGSKALGAYSEFSTVVSTIDKWSNDPGAADPDYRDPTTHKAWQGVLVGCLVEPAREHLDMSDRPPVARSTGTRDTVSFIPGDRATARLPFGLLRGTTGFDPDAAIWSQPPTVRTLRPRALAPSLVGTFRSMVLHALNGKAVEAGWTTRTKAALTYAGDQAAPWETLQADVMRVDDAGLTWRDISSRLSDERPDLLFLLGDGTGVDGGGWTIPGTTIPWTDLVNSVGGHPPAIVVLGMCHSSSAAADLAAAGVPLTVGFAGEIDSTATTRLVAVLAEELAPILQSGVSHGDLSVDGLVRAVWRAHDVVKVRTTPAIWVHPNAGLQFATSPAHTRPITRASSTAWYVPGQLTLDRLADGRIVRMPIPVDAGRAVEVTVDERTITVRAYPDLAMPDLEALQNRWPDLAPYRFKLETRRAPQRGQIPTGTLKQWAGRTAEVAATARALAAIFGESVPDELWAWLLDIVDQDFGTVDAAPRLHVVGEGCVRRYARWPAWWLEATAKASVRPDAVVQALEVQRHDLDAAPGEFFRDLHEVLDLRSSRPKEAIGGFDNQNYFRKLLELDDLPELNDRRSGGMLGQWMREQVDTNPHGPWIAVPAAGLLIGRSARGALRVGSPAPEPTDVFAHR